MKNLTFEIFKSALYLKSGSMPLRKESLNSSHFFMYSLPIGSIDYKGGSLVDAGWKSVVGPPIIDPE